MRATSSNRLTQLNIGRARMAFFRDEDYHILSKIKHKLKNEGNDFLGQKIIDVHALNGSSDIWYSLGQLRADVLAAGDGDMMMMMMMMMMLPWCRASLEVL